MDDNHDQTLLHTGSGNMRADVSPPSSRPLSALAPHRNDGAVKEQRSSIHTFYHQLLGLFRDALKAGGCPHCLNGRARTKAEHNLSRLYMWAQGLDLDHIERNVDEGSELQSSVAGALAEIAKIVTSGIVYNPSAAVPRSNSLDLFPFGLHHKEQIDMSLTSRYFDDGEHSEKESDSSDSDSDEDADNQATTHRHMQSLNQIDNHVTNLMDLLPTLHYSSKTECHPTVEASQSMLQMPSELLVAARPYIVQVHDKFRNIDKDLANRLGEANWQRYLRFNKLARRIRGQEWDDDEEDPVITGPSFFPVSEFRDSGLGSSVPAKSKYANSEISHASFLSTQSARGRGVARVPRTPSEVDRGESFSCCLCGKVLKHVKSRADWKMHVFADLRPYICTYKDCKLDRTTFPSRELWERHEWQQHRSRQASQCQTCNTTFDLAQDYLTHMERQHHGTQPTDAAHREVLLLAGVVSVVEDVRNQLCHICTRTGFETKRGFDSHVARHMEELALIAIPRDVDSDNENANEGPILPNKYLRAQISPFRTGSPRESDNEDADENVVFLNYAELPKCTPNIGTARESVTAVNNEDGHPDGLQNDEKDGDRATFRTKPYLTSDQISIVREKQGRDGTVLVARKFRVRKQQYIEGTDAEIQRLRDTIYRMGEP